MLGTSHRHWPPTFRVAAALVSVLAVGGILYFAQAVLIPIALAALLTFLLTPVVSRLERWGLARIPAVGIVLVVAMAFFAGSGWLVYAQLSSLASVLPRYRENIKEKIEGVKSLLHGGAIERIQETVAVVREDLKEDQRGSESVTPEDVVIPVRVQESNPFFGADRLLSATQVLGTAGIALVLSLFMLIKREDVMHRVVSLGGRDSLAATTKALQEASRRISRYLLMQFLVNLSFGICVGLGLWLIGVPYALLWGACAMVFRYVPFVGPWVAALLPITVSLITSSTWTPVLLVIALFVVLELINNNLLEPYLYGRSVGISEVGVILAAICWAWLWGPIGLIVATPITVCLVVLGKYVPALSIFDRLLGDHPSLKPHVWLYQRLLSGDEDSAEDIVEEFAAKTNPMQTCDELLLPAIMLTHRECAAGRISDDDEDAIMTALAELIDEHIPADAEEKPQSAGRDRALPLVMGIAWVDGERAALEMLGRLLANRCVLQILTPDMLISQWLDELQEKQPACLFISSLPPGELTRARLVAKRVRSQVPDLRIAVGRWGSKQVPERRRQAFREAGVSAFVATLDDATSALIPMIQFHIAASKSAPAGESAAQSA